uniref:CRAL-TRIO domain-containing protein n=1 Tax=Aplanochytrium stocchinoi TaxID=215587 RepID=A0A7S3PJY2_9STRA
MDVTEQKSGFLGSLNEQQSEALDELKERMKESKFAETIKNHPQGDCYLLRFLRATMKNKTSKRVFRVEDAEKRLLKVLEWKESNQIQEPPEKLDVFRKVYPNYHWVDSKAGTLVWINRLGEAFNNMKPEHLTREMWGHCVGHEMEMAEEELRSTVEPGQEFRGYVSVADCKGIGLGALTRLSLISFISDTAGYNYPEVVGKIVLVNTPWIFPKLFAAFKPFIDKDTLSKFQIHSDIPLEFFRNEFDLDKLPVEYGGNNEMTVPYPLDSKKYTPGQD